MEYKGAGVMDRMMENRKFMRSEFHREDIVSDQEQGLPQPPLQKPVTDGAEIIGLPKFDESIFAKTDVYACLKDRRSRRKYKDHQLSLQELSFLLWATQGVDRKMDNNYATFRPVASAGARHPFETYLWIFNVEGLKKGVYRYLALSHELMFVKEVEGLEEKANAATLGQVFVGNSAVTLVWSCVPYRGEWRYNITSHKAMLLDAGHVCQNLYIACEAVGSGTCAIAAYDQRLCDELIDVDGTEEFTVYLAPVAKY
jgi:SagB-type dehydrogenase family enzyme